MPRKYLFIITVAVLAALTLIPRILDLDAFISPDEIRWVTNTAGFTNKLAHGEFSQLLRQPHPGITTQWLGAMTFRSDSWTIRKLPLVIGQTILVLMIVYLAYGLWGTSTSILLGILLALNPFLIAHTRVYAMDSLLALNLTISVLALMLWHKAKAARYLVFSAFAAAAAILSKLPGIISVPYAGLLFLYWSWQSESIKAYIKPGILWIISLCISLGIILPSIALHPVNIIGDFTEFFRSDDYQELHQLSSLYYLQILIFKTTPLHFAALFILILGAVWSTINRHRPLAKKIRAALFTPSIGIFLLFAILFVIQMTMGAKKGDRYILPSFIMFDIVTALIIARLAATKKRNVTNIILITVTVGLLWQIIMVARLHPHTLAYVNPITRQFISDHRLGWGEGLDLAAQYLNNKPAANELNVAAYFPTQFAYVFRGKTTAAHNWDNESIDYVVLYRAMFQRGEEAWETDVINHFRDKTPEKVISLSGIEMVWIYRQ